MTKKRRLAGLSEALRKLEQAEKQEAAKMKNMPGFSELNKLLENDPKLAEQVRDVAQFRSSVIASCSVLTPRVTIPAIMGALSDLWLDAGVTPTKEALFSLLGEAFDAVVKDRELAKGMMGAPNEFRSGRVH